MAIVNQTMPPGRVPAPVYYPDSDGQPMADNTLQWEWIATIKNGLEAQYRDRPDVFIAGDLLWYALEGDPKVRVAPDVLVVFGRPKGFRGSYRQWEEDGLAPQVVFEILSPGNKGTEMLRKFRFYERHEVLEYYIYDPGDPRDDVLITTLTGWQRAEVNQPFEEIEPMDGWRSPRLDITFKYNPLDGLKLLHPDSTIFETYVEITARAEQMAQQVDQMTQQVDQMTQQAELERQRAERLTAQLRAAGIDPES